MTTILDCADEIWVEVEDSERDRLWQQSQAESSRPAFAWQSYVNQLCVSGVVAWLQDDEVFPQTYDRLEMNSFPGVAVRFNADQFILLPSEAIDQSELRVPQEWVDIPPWTGDYYLAVQVNPDEGQIKVWGYTTHRTLKQQGHYHEGDRTYSLDREQLITNMDILMVSRELCPDEPRQVSVSPVAALASTQAESLIERLARPTVLVPRLEVPFEQWGALLAHEEWRSRLDQALKMASPSSSVSASEGTSNAVTGNNPLRLGQGQNLLPLGEWVARGWQTLDTLIPANPANAAWAMAFRGSNRITATEISMGKGLVFDAEGRLVSVLLLVRAVTEPDNRVMIQVQLRPESDARQAMDTIPEGMELALLAPTGEVIQSVQGRCVQGTDSPILDAFIQLKRFRLPGNTPFNLRIQLGDETLTETFTT